MCRHAADRVLDKCWWSLDASFSSLSGALPFRQTHSHTDCREKAAKRKHSWPVTPSTNNNLHTPSPDRAAWLEGKQTDRKWDRVGKMRPANVWVLRSSCLASRATVHTPTQRCGLSNRRGMTAKTLLTRPHFFTWHSFLSGWVTSTIQTHTNVRSSAVTNTDSVRTQSRWWTHLYFEVTQRPLFCFFNQFNDLLKSSQELQSKFVFTFTKDFY